jgi:hypothetical protein
MGTPRSSSSRSGPPNRLPPSRFAEPVAAALRRRARPSMPTGGLFRCVGAAGLSRPGGQPMSSLPESGATRGCAASSAGRRGAWCRAVWLLATRARRPGSDAVSFPVDLASCDYRTTADPPALMRGRVCCCVLPECGVRSALVCSDRAPRRLSWGRRDRFARRPPGG